MDILRVFRVLNYLLGTTIVVSAFNIYLTKNKKIPLYIALAIMIAGPLEDLLIAYIKMSQKLPSGDKEHYADIVNNTTSLAFLVLLGLAVLKTADD